MTPTRDQVLSEPAGRRLDAWICEHVLGWKHGQSETYCEPGTFVSCPVCSPPRFSTEIAAAWLVVEKLASGQQVHLMGGGDCYAWRAVFGWKLSVSRGHQADAETPALALCRAALLAVLP